MRKADLKDLAAHINRLQVATYMINTRPKEDRKIWQQAEKETTLYLFERYKIELPNLKFWQENKNF